MNPASQDYDPEQREQIFVWEELAQDSLKNLNKGQRDIFDEVMKALEEKRQLLLFISGDGGTGKLNELRPWLRCRPIQSPL